MADEKNNKIDVKKIIESNKGKVELNNPNIPKMKNPPPPPPKKDGGGDKKE